jgi:predicted HicB family RNase H-like nuclease
MEIYQDADGRIHCKIHDPETLAQLQRNAAQQGISLDEFMKKALDAAFPGAKEFTKLKG